MDKIEAALLSCIRCKYFTAYRSRKKGGVHMIDTLCRVCGSRLRHTARYQNYWTLQGVVLGFRQGPGGHNVSRSVGNVIRCKPSEVNRLCAERNRSIKLSIAEAEGFDISLIGGKKEGEQE